MKSRSLSVYEALNHGRKEIFVGVTARPLLELIVVPRDWFPVEIAHWEPSETLAVRRIKDGMTVEEAWKFSAVYVSYIERQGWTIIRQKPDV